MLYPFLNVCVSILQDSHLVAVGTPVSLQFLPFFPSASVSNAMTYIKINLKLYLPHFPFGVSFLSVLSFSGCTPSTNVRTKTQRNHIKQKETMKLYKKRAKIYFTNIFSKSLNITLAF